MQASQAALPVAPVWPASALLPFAPPSLQLPSKRQIMAKILREREEAAAMKQDPVFVDPDAEARARLQALKAGGAAPPPPFKTAQDELRELEERERAAEEARQAAAAAAQRPQDGAAPAAAPALPEDGIEGEGGGEQEGGGVGCVDPTAGMNARQRKLHELQQRMKAARKANEHAVVAEKRKQAAGKVEAAGGGDGGPPRQGSSQKWFEEKQKRKVRLRCTAALQGPSKGPPAQPAMAARP